MDVRRRSQLDRRRRRKNRRQTGVSVGLGDWELDFNLIPFLNEVVSIAAGVIIGTVIERRWRSFIDG